MNRIRGFDGIRGLAIIAVVLAHTHALGWLPSEFSRLVSGITVFLVFSGFLITAMLMREYDRTGTILVGRFYWRRAVRILPLYFCFIVAIVAINATLKSSLNVSAILHAATFTTNFIARESYSGITGSTWSISIQEHFYLVWPLVFIGLYRKPIALITCVTIAILASLALQQYLMGEPIAKLYYVHRWTFVAGGQIAIGCLAALVVHRLRFFLRSDLMLIVGIVLWGSLPLMPDWLSYSRVLPIGIALIICWVYLNQDSLFTKALDTPILRRIGMMAYGIYIYQGLFITTGPKQWWGGWPLPWYVGLLCVVVISPLSYKYFEIPLARKLRKLPLGSINGYLRQSARHDERTMASRKRLPNQRSRSPQASS